MLRELFAVFDIHVDAAELERVDRLLSQQPQRAAQAQAALSKIGQSLGAQTPKIAGVNKGLESSQSLVEGLAGAFATYFGLGAAKQFVEDQVKAAAALQTTSNRLGVATEDLQVFQYMTKITGGEIETAGEAFKFLSKSIGSALGGDKESNQTFASLGVQIKDASGEARSMVDLLPELADRFASLKTDSERTVLAMKLFGKGGQALVPLLKGGAAGVKGLAKEFQELGGPVGKDTIQALADVADNIDRFSFAMKLSKAALMKQLLPYLQKGIDLAIKGAKWFQKLSRETNILKYAAVALGGGAAAGVLSLAGAFTKLIGLSKAGGIKGLLSIGPQGLLTIAVIVGIAAVLEDLYVLFTGGESYIGDFLDQLFGVGAAQAFIEGTKKTVEDLGKAFAPMIPVVKALGEILAKAFSNALPTILEIIKEKLTALAAIFTGIADFALLAANNIGWVIEQFGKLTKMFGDSKVGKFLSEKLGIDISAKGAGMEGAGRAIEQSTQTNKDPIDVLKQVGQGLRTLAPGPTDLARIGGAALAPGTLGVGSDFQNTMRASRDSFVPTALQPMVPRDQIVPPVLRAPSNSESAGANNTVSQDNRINITVQGGTTNAETGKVVGGATVLELQKTFNQAKGALPRGGK